MAYQTLGKLYYSDPHTYAQIYQSRLYSEDTIRLDFMVAGKQAFFIRNVEVMKLAYNIVKLDKMVSSLSSALPGIAKGQYSKKCLIDEIVLTNRIEGVYSSRKEIGEALDILEKQSDEKGKHQRFRGLVHKYLKLMTGEKISLRTCEDVRAIYDEVFLEEVLAEDPGNIPDGKIFRKDPTAVHSATDKVIHSGLYPEDQIIAAMEKALAFLNDESVDDLCRVCIFHYLIEYIHPFYDGNGRLGRYILSDCLTGVLEPLLAYRISETIKENINAYYKAFKTCNDPHNLGDLTPFLLMMLGMIHTALQDLWDSLTQKRDSWHKYEELIGSFSEAADKDVRKMYSYLIQAALFSEKGISTDELKTFCRCSYYKVKKVLGQLQKELIIAEMKGKEKYYQMDLTKLDDILLEKELKKLITE